jgi:hypothetical protein
MAAPAIVPQGTSYSFTYTLDGLLQAGFAYLLEVKDFPGSAASISRIVTINSYGDVPVTITPAETTTLAVKLWHATIKSTDSDETIQGVQRFQITEPWI